VRAHPELRLAGTLTHFAVADEPENEYTAVQQQRFDAALGELRANGIDPGVVHACNTAGALAFPAARYDMVRVGIGIYGIAPAPALEGRVALQPALSVKARVSYVKDGRRGPGARFVRVALRDPERGPHRDGSHRVRGRRATPPRARSCARARPGRALRDRGNHHDGPADARRQRRTGRGRR
jgi:hypothetical protein